MAHKRNSRYLEMLKIAVCSNPIETLRFITRSLSGEQTPVKLKFRQNTLTIRPNTHDLRVVRSLMLGEFDDAIAKVVSKHRFIIDAGGYIGATGALFARAFPNSQVVVLEPSEENYSLAESNTRKLSNVTVLRAALASEDGKVELKDRGTGAWGFTIVDEADDASSMASLGEVPAISVPSLLKRFDAQGVDLLKLDIEGGEYDLLSGRPNWVGLCGVVVAELHDKIRPGCTGTFEDAMNGRHAMPLIGEKAISISPSLWT